MTQSNPSDTGVTRAQATAAPTTVKLAGKEYRLSPFRDIDLGEFEEWLRGKAFQVATAGARAANLSEADRKVVLERAFDTANAISFTSPEGLRAMLTVEGCSRLLHLAARANHPELTIPVIQDMLRDPATLEDSMAALDRINALPNLAKKKGARRLGKTPRRRVR
jgi:hypothetical protein